MTTSITQAFLLAIQILYALCSLSLLLVAVNSIFSLYHYHKASKVNDQIVQPEPEYWPAVTVQLPIYNENSVIIGLLDVITGLDYPKDKLEIQVLDNSTDSTSLLAKELVEQYLDQGFNIRFHYRDSREGYKAGNLTEGLKTASGKFLAIFDADFIPQRDWIKRCVVHFSDPTLGFVQTRWTFHNRTQNELTRMASQVLDSHFLIEAIARSGNNLFLNFNGSAGMWRKEALISAGGWQTDTLVTMPR